jgi:hypothetical protein
VLYVISIAALLIACAACALSSALLLRVQKSIGKDPDISAIRSTPPTPVALGTQVLYPNNLIDVNGKPFPLPADSTEPWILAFHSLACGGCRQQLPGYRKFLVERGISRERAISIATGDRSDLSWLTDGIGSAGQVVHVPEDSSLLVDLKITTWPAYLVIGRESTVTHATQSAARLATLQLPELSQPTNVQGL